MIEQTIQEALDNADEAKQRLKEALEDAITFHEELIKMLLEKLSKNKQ